MRITVDRERLNKDLDLLIPLIEDWNMHNDACFYKAAINRWYNQQQDWVNHPELAKKNPHHSEEDLSLAIISCLLGLNRFFSDEFGFDGASYITTSEALT